jgi:rubrerythrin
MQLTKTKTFRHRADKARKAPRRQSAPRAVTDSRPAAMPVSQVRARRGGGSEDRALYSCECGFAWTGEVTASPSCPHCGQPQAW